MQQAKSGLETLRIDTNAEFEALTIRRDNAKTIFDSRVITANTQQLSFIAASSSYDTATTACTTTSNDAVATVATLTVVTTDRDTRNPVIIREKAVIAELIQKVGELRNINLQENAGVSKQQAARNAAVSQTRAMIVNLQTFESEAGPLSEMIELAREHAEFTQPILNLLNQLIAKLDLEQGNLNTAVSTAATLNSAAQQLSTTNCNTKADRLILRYAFLGGLTLNFVLMVAQERR